MIPISLCWGGQSPEGVSFHPCWPSREDLSNATICHIDSMTLILDTEPASGASAKSSDEAVSCCRLLHPDRKAPLLHGRTDRTGRRAESRGMDLYFIYVSHAARLARTFQQAISSFPTVEGVA